MWLKYKKVWLFLAKFFGTYLLLTLIYQAYLASFNNREFPHHIDTITVKVAQQAVQLGNILHLPTQTFANKREASMAFYYQDQYVSRIVEGCNAVSVMILFLSFIIAFSGTLLDTLSFGGLGIILIYSTNLVRILVINWAIYQFPNAAELLHQMVFPLIIYGFTFLLWVVWVKRIENANPLNC